MTPIVIDISHHNTVLPQGFHGAYSHGVRGVIHKATQGTRYVDPSYRSRKMAALDAGMLWGAYHFNTGEDVERQLDHFLSVVQPDDHTLVALDFEDNPPSEMSGAQAIQWLKLCEQKIGRKAVLYGGNRIKEHLPSIDPYLAAHRLWLCQYGPKAVLPKAWKQYWLWQYSDGIHGPGPHGCPGLTGYVDLNAYNGNDLAGEWV